jgi:hypothetical protein
MSEDTLAADILRFLKKVSTEYFLPPDQRDEAASLYARAGLPPEPAEQGAPAVYATLHGIPGHADAVDVTLNEKVWKMSKNGYEEAKQHCIDGRLIQAIKVVRAETGAGLKEAKDLVEQSTEFAPFITHRKGW